MSLPPVEIPLGAMRFNSDSQKLEYWMGSAWMQVHTFNPDLDGGARGLTSGLYNPSPAGAVDNIDYITIATQGNAIDFGNLTAITHDGGSLASRTRYCHAGGSREGSNTDVIEYVTIASTGNAVDFGDLTATLYQGTACGNQTRGIVYQDAGAPSGTHSLDYITIASTGNAAEFGNIYGNNGARQNPGALASPTRMVIGGGGYPNVLEGMDYITISTLGDSQDFGDLNVAARSQAGCSNATRGVFCGGGPPSNINIMEHIQIATLGNAVNYGDLAASDGGGHIGGMSSKVRGVWNGGGDTNVMSCFSLQTAGDTVDFGDSVNAYSSGRSSSNSHGGLG